MRFVFQQYHFNGSFRESLEQDSEVLEAGEIMQVNDTVLLGGNRTVKIQELL